MRRLLTRKPLTTAAVVAAAGFLSVCWRIYDSVRELEAQLDRLRAVDRAEERVVERILEP